MTTIKLDLEGFYTYSAWKSISDDGSTGLPMVIDEKNHTVSGSGKDHPGSFAISGVFVGDDIRFIKQYVNCNGNVAWKYVGKRIEPKGGNVYQFSGGWGQGSSQFGQWVLSGVDKHSNGCNAPPHHPIEGQWTGQYLYATDPNQKDAPMELSLGLDPDVKYVADGPYGLRGSGTDGVGPFTFKGTITKAGDLDLEKHYTNQAGLKWRYQGGYDEAAGTVNGIWSDTSDNASPDTHGSFTLKQTAKLTTATATAIMPKGTVLFGAPSAHDTRSTIQTAVHSAQQQTPAVSVQLLSGLVDGFSGHA